MKTTRPIAALFPLLCTLGCATAERAGDHVNPHAPLWFHRPIGAMHVLLREPLTVEGRLVGEAYERGRPELDPAHDRVFVGSSDHGLYALRASDGSTSWRFETVGAVQSEPLYDAARDVVYFGSNDGALYAVDARDGRLRWRFFTGAEVARRPALGATMLYVVNGADQLFALDRDSGKQRWHVHRNPALGMEIAGHAGPALDRGKVYIAFSDGHVAAYDAADGAEKWAVDLSAEAEQTAQGEAPRYLDVDTTPVLATLPNGSRAAFVASFAGGVFALDADSGARIWSNERASGVTDLLLFHEAAHLPSPYGPDRNGAMVPERKMLIASAANTGLWALDPATGRAQWSLPVPEGGITAPAQVAGALVVGTTRYGLFLLSPRNGRVIDGLDLGTGFAQTPAAYGRRVYAMSNGGTLLGVQIDVPIDRSPFVADSAIPF